MESIEIKNFLTIREATLEVRRFTIIIGPQANGKSVIAKLLYFFRDFLSTTFIKSAQNLEGKRELQRSGIATFEQLFPRYAWSDQEFSVCYRSGDIEITLASDGGTGKGSALRFGFSENLAELHRKIKKQYKTGLESTSDAKSEYVFHRRSEVFEQVMFELLYTTPWGKSFRRSIFIPASRSFFANLQKNVFSFLANSLTIDPLIKEFGSVYESARTQYRMRNRLLVSRSDEAKQRLKIEREQQEALQEDIKGQIERIIAGEYLYEDDQDWIISQNRRINLINASSGQQEALPLLIVLKATSNVLRPNKNRPIHFFIEEPEAHLFPTSQRRLVEMFSRLYNEQGTNFFLTTHSPYILTAFNNLITASNLVERQANKEKVNEVVRQNNWVYFDDVGAYTIRDGQLQSILDEELKIIGPTVIDSVSDEFDSVFDNLMKIELCNETN